MIQNIDNKIMRTTMKPGLLRLCMLFIVLTAGSATAEADGVVVHGNVYGGGNQADVQVNTEVKISTGTVEGNVYGGGNLGDVGTHADQNPASTGNYDWKDQDGSIIDENTAADKMTGVCKVNITGGTVGPTEENATADENHGNVFGGGKGAATTFECEQGMVYRTNVSINTTGAVVKGNVYGGGEVSRVEENTVVTIGTASGSDEPTIEGCAFAAGAGLKTHGYSALVRGTSALTVQGKAKVLKNVYGGGEKASVGRYKVKTPVNESDSDVPSTLPYGMPAHLISGGTNTVTIQDNAVIGTDNVSTTGHVYGAGQGLEPQNYDFQTQAQYSAIDGNSADNYKIDEHQPKRMVSGDTWEYFTTKAAYLQFVETLALSASTDVTITGSAEVKGSVFGGSESGSVYHDTGVKIQGGTVNGDAFGGGRGLESFAEAGRVRGNTSLIISNGTINGNVYGGGNLGDVGTINKADQTNHNYLWKNSDANGNNLAVSDNNNNYDNTAGNNTITGTNKNTGVCTVTISGGTIGVDNPADATKQGNVFGAGKGLGDTFWCEKAMAFATDVTIKKSGTTSTVVNGTVFGGGEIGRVEDDTKVTIGTASGSDEPEIKGNVFGAGKGLDTHGYSALVRGNPIVIVQGKAKVGHSVYGGGEIASVGKHKVKTNVNDPDAPSGLPLGMPYTLENTNLGICTVTVKDQAEITGSVFGAGQGVVPSYDNTKQRMGMSGWESLSEDVYNTFIQTLALATDTYVTIGGSASGTNTKVKGSVFGGSESGFVQYHTNVNIQSNCEIGTTSEGTTTGGDVFGGGLGVEGNADAGRVSGYTTLTISGGTMHGSVYGGGENGIVKGGVTVNVSGGTVNHDVYGGGALADTNTGNGSQIAVPGLTVGESSVEGLYEKTYTYTKTTDEEVVAGKTYYEQSGTEYVAVSAPTSDDISNYYERSETYTQLTSGTAQANKTYYTNTHPTSVDLTGGLIKGDAYGGGLGQKTGFNNATSNIEAVVWGDIAVTLNGTAFNISHYTDEGYTNVVKSGRVFGANNLNGSPQGNVTVTVWKTVADNVTRTTAAAKANNKLLRENNPDNYESVEGYVTPTYELAAVYGGGNLASFTTTGKKASVIIHGCGDTSIETVYGGGNAAAVPETAVDVYSCYEIGALFGGGNGKDKYKNDSGWKFNSGANVNGNANTMIYGGTVHEAYGGSNELGTITGDVTIDIADSGLDENNPNYCELDCAQLVGAGRNADVNGDLKIIMGCKPETKIPLVFGGADNANVNGDVELTITSGNFGKVVGGNNDGGCVKGHIYLNIEETTCIPINIDHIYLCGYNAAYSQYGYYVKTNETDTGTGTGADTETAILSNGKLQLMPRESATDSHLPVDTYSYTIDDTTGDVTATWTTLPITGDSKFEGYAAPVLNVISCTSIGEVFGGGYGEDATVYGNPTVNINMIPGGHADKIDRDGDEVADDPTGKLLGAIGDVYGGGDAAAVYGNTTVNIGTETSTSVYVFDDTSGEYVLQYETVNGVETPKTLAKTVTGAYITGNVYGGGKLADVTENTFVNVCAVKGSEILDGTAHTGKYNYSVVDLATSAGSDYQGVTIGGNVYGGGKGQAMMEKGTAGEAFLCAKAMVGVDGAGIEDKDNNGKADHPEGGTTVVIANGTVGTTLADGTLKAGTGYVYGGGEVGRVEKNTNVTIGIGNGTGNSSATSKPVILGNVFGAGAGKNTHGYSALVRGTSTVLVEGDAKVMGSVYGGGEKASVGRYRVGDDGLPQVLNNALAPTSGYCYVTIRGYAEIGPDGMIMNNTTTGKPDDAGHVFGACQGVLPYQDADEEPKHMDGERQSDGSWEDELKTYPAYNASATLDGDYEKFIKSLALATQTLVTIEGNAFVKGSVYGGSENGFVQKDTRVVVSGGQIGNGYVQMDDDGNYLAAANRYSVNRRYTDAEWSAKHLIKDGETNYASSLPECASWPYGQAAAAADRYAPYDKDANTTGDLTKYANGNLTEGGRAVGDDGHTFFGNVFGGGSGYYPYKPGRWFEDAGAVYGNTQVDITGGHILTNIYGGNEMTNVGVVSKENTGKCTVNFGGTATLGVPRTLKQIDAHPVTCYLFGAGKGDQRVLFNKSTNVKDVEVNITGGTIYGSVFGGGEDGHVLRDVVMTIGTQTTTGGVTTTSGPTIGTWGTSYVDGNIFGGGRGFGGDAYTAGNIAGTVTMIINGGKMLGSIYGGGRLGSVGYGLYDKGVTGYGEMRDDDKLDDGTDGSSYFTKGRGHIDITINGGTIGNTHEYIVPNASNIPTSLSTDISTWTAADWTTWKEHNSIPKTEFDTATGRLSHTKGGNVFAGGMGRFYQLDGTTVISSVDWWKLGRVKSTTLTITGGEIKSCVYGGGELGWVSGTHSATIGSESKDVSTDITITDGTIGTVVTEAVTTGEGEGATTSDVPRYTFGSVFGGGFGSAMEKLYATEDETTITDNPKFYAGRVVGSTKIDMSGGKVLASIYGGGETASVGLGTTYGETGVTGFAPANVSTNINITGGEVGKDKVGTTYFGGATMGNVYGGGCGVRSIVRCGLIFGNANVNISGNDTKVYHNVYGGGAFGSVGDFSFHTEMDNEHGTIKVTDIEDLATAGTGIANITISGGTIGTDGYENGMVFGSSRGEVQGNAVRDDYGAWVYNTNVTIGAKDATTGAETGPTVKGSVYGSGENGHVFNNTYVTVNGGKVGIDDSSDPGYTVTSNGNTYSGAAYPNRGNVYGGGCGTDKYDSNNDGTDDAFKPLAGVVYGTTTVNINGGTVVHNVYGAGALGSVGRAVTANGVTTISGGTTTINVSGGTIGASGTVGDGNVFGAARGDVDATINAYALARKETNVSVTGGEIKGNVYGGGELGCVGTFTVSSDMRTFTWQDTDGNANTAANTDSKNTGICNVTVDGSSAVINGHVFGAGKGKDDTFWCEKGIAYSTKVSITNGTVNSNVYGGGEVGRVETDTEVKIGNGAGTTGGASAPTITGSVFGGGAGVETHGYSALVRNNTTVTVEGNAAVGHSVYGGGEIASVGKYGLDESNMPSILQGGGYCYVNVQGNATVGEDVFGAGKGVTPHFDSTNEDPSKRSRRMTLKSGWQSLVGAARFDWDYLQTEEAYSTYLETLALATHPEVTIDGSAAVSGSVFGGGELGLTKGSVVVNIQGGTIAEDVYGGGSLANTNTTTKADLDNDGVLETISPTTTVKLMGGIIEGDAYGGGLGRLAKDAEAGEHYTQAEIDVAEEGDDAYGKTTSDWKVEPADAVSAVEAKVYGDVLVELNGTTTKTTTGGTTVYGTTPTSSDKKGCTVGRIFGCNNLNGSPKGEVLVHVHATQKAGAASLSVKSAATKNSDGDYDVTSFDVKAVYGGGNMAAYEPVKATGTDAEKAQAYTNVIIDGCQLTSIGQVYGGGNAASAPATEVVVNGTYEIGDVFGGGNGKDAITVNGVTQENPGANVGYLAYTSDSEKAAAAYGSGKAHATIYGGTVHAVYGGSNSKGNIRVEARATLEDAEVCTFDVGEAYGGGRNAEMDGDAVLEIGCISGLGKAYGGAADADINGDVTLNITNGTYGQVFGGNDAGGKIGGTITVNIEETGCRPIIIGELYGGGNEAAYSVENIDRNRTDLDFSDPTASNYYKNYPQLNVHSFTSIGKVFGGGYGAPAEIVGNPTVNISVYEGKYYNTNSGRNSSVINDNARVVGSKVAYSADDAAGYADGFPIPSHAKGKIGAINTVFGGGNAAKVIGNPTVNVGTEAGDEVYAVVDVATGADVKGLYTRSGEGTTESPYTYTEITTTTPAKSDTTYYLKTTKAVDIRGNVFGGGNEAEVEGDTNVVIGRKEIY